MGDNTGGANLMPIGRFSSACRLSVKALRYYDERGILTPAYVDSRTGYRYYRAEQARDAVMLAMLRSLDVPLKTVERMLRASGDELKRHLEEERERVERDLARRRRTLSSIERLARSGNLIPYTIGVREEPHRRLASMSMSTAVERMVEESGALVYELLDVLVARNDTPGAPIMCINESSDEAGNVTVHACAQIRDEANISAPITMRDIKGGPAAWLTHVGAYEELGIAYHALNAWVQQHGHEQRADLQEIYLNDPAETQVAELVTEVLLPIYP